MTLTTAPATRRLTHPFFYLLLIIPFGATTGFIGTTLAYLLSNKGGVSVAAVAVMISLSTAPNSFKFLWAPIVDYTLNAKLWYMIAAVLTALGIFLMGVFPATAKWLTVITILGFITNFASTLMAMAIESLIAYNTPTEDMGRVSGWYQAGNLGGSGLGAGLALWIAEKSDLIWLPGAVLALICLACAYGLVHTETPVHEVADPSLAKSAQESGLGNIICDKLLALLRDVWHIVSHNAGFLALMICFLPIGSGGLTTTFPTVNKEWGITDGVLVGNINGTWGGMISAIGSLIGGYVCQAMDNKRAYALFGLIMCICAVAMAHAARTPNMYIAFVLVYQFIVGLSYAAFTAVVLEVIGKGAAATKYNVFASLSNVPINYMGFLNGRAYDTCGDKSWLFAACGSTPMLYTDAGMGLIGIVVFLLLAMLARRYLR